MAIVVNCPSCDRKLRVPDEMLGKKVKCPKCGDTFKASEEANPPPMEEEPPPKKSSGVRERPSGTGKKPRPPEPEPEEEQEVEARPRRRTSDDDDPDDEPRMPRRRSGRRSGLPSGNGAIILVMGIGSAVLALISVLGLLVGFCCVGPFGSAPTLLGLPLGIIAWVMGQRDLRRIREGAIDPNAKGLTTGGWICGIVGTILNAILIVIGLILIVMFLGFLGAAINSKPTVPTRIAPPPRKVEIRTFFAWEEGPSLMPAVSWTA